jgi:6-phosphogluconolactonase (cycloisomerase 2 family)
VNFSAGGGIDTFDISNPAKLVSISSQVYPGRNDNLTAPQEQSRPHEAILDPTGEFLVFPDLGADYIRVLHVDKETLTHTEKVCKPPRRVITRNLSHLKILTVFTAELRV